MLSRAVLAIVTVSLLQIGYLGNEGLDVCVAGGITSVLAAVMKLFSTSLPPFITILLFLHNFLKFTIPQCTWPLRSMPRVVPIVHRAPPPPLEEVLAEPVPPGGGLGLMSSTSIKNASLAPHITHSHKRRTHIPSSNGSSSASKLANGHSNAAKASNSSSDKHFSLFDQIQELVRHSLDITHCFYCDIIRST